MPDPVCTTLQVFRKAIDMQESEGMYIHDFMVSCEGLRKSETEGTDFRDLNSKAHVALRVDIQPASERPDGDLATDVPNILIKQLVKHDDGHIHLTWEEARMLCAALWQVTNIAEFG